MKVQGQDDGGSEATEKEGCMRGGVVSRVDGWARCELE